jgi:hypothetical protein
MMVEVKLGLAKLRKIKNGKKVMIGKADVVSELPEVKPKGPKRTLNAGLAAYLEKKKAAKMGKEMPQEGDGFGSFLGAIARPVGALAAREGSKALGELVAKKIEGGRMKKGKKKGGMTGGTFKLKTG